MSISVSIHTAQEKNFNAEVKTQFTASAGHYPTFIIEYGAGYAAERVVIFPSFQQLKEIQEALDQYIKECEESGRFVEKVGAGE
jgi:PHP family Zn ribbon phosphoesterase